MLSRILDNLGSVWTKCTASDEGDPSSGLEKEGHRGAWLSLGVPVFDHFPEVVAQEENLPVSLHVIGKNRDLSFASG